MTTDKRAMELRDQEILEIFYSICNSGGLFLPTEEIVEETTMRAGCTRERLEAALERRKI